MDQLAHHSSSEENRTREPNAGAHFCRESRGRLALGFCEKRRLWARAEHRQENRKKIERIPGIQPKGCLTIGALGSGGDTSAFIATEPGDSSTPLQDDPELWIVVECDDILGKHHGSIFA